MKQRATAARLRSSPLKVASRGCLAALLLCGCAGAPTPPQGAAPDELLVHVAKSMADGSFTPPGAFRRHPLPVLGLEVRGHRVPPQE